MSNSSTQIPFMLAAFIAVMVHTVISEPKFESKDTINIAPKAAQQEHAKVAAALDPVPVKFKR